MYFNLFQLPAQVTPLPCTALIYSLLAYGENELGDIRGALEAEQLIIWGESSNQLHQQATSKGSGDRKAI